MLTSEMTNLKPGDWIEGEYRIRRVFGGEGKSGMGIVYLVEGRTSEEPFVLKTFQKSRQNSATVARFKQEAETWVKLGKHPNLVQCFWVREIGSQLFVAAEYIYPNSNGENTLTQHLSHGRVHVNQQIEWIIRIRFYIEINIDIWAASKCWDIL